MEIWHIQREGERQGILKKTGGTVREVPPRARTCSKQADKIIEQQTPAFLLWNCAERIFDKLPGWKR